SAVAPLGVAPAAVALMDECPAEGIVGIEPQPGLAGNVGSAGDGRGDLAAVARVPAVARAEAAADQALLGPRLALFELALGRETGELGAGAGAARGAIVGTARAEHEVACARSAAGRAGEQLDVIDLGETGGIHRLSELPGKLTHGRHVAGLYVCRLLW